MKHAVKNGNKSVSNIRETRTGTVIDEPVKLIWLWKDEVVHLLLLSS